MAINVGELFILLDLRDTMSAKLQRAVVRSHSSATNFGTRLGQVTSGAVQSLTATAVAATATAVKFAVLSAAAVSTAGHLQSLGAALAPAGGIIAALPGVAALGAAGLATLALAFRGVGDAASAALGDDEEAFHESLAGLSREAQGAARELRQLKPVIDGLRLSVQDSFFAPLAGQITAVADALSASVSAGMSAVAAQFGLAGLAVADFLRTADTASAVEAVFGSLADAIAALTPAIQPVAAGLRDLVVVGAAFSAGLAPGIASAAARLGTFLSTAAASGRALEWMTGAVEVFKQLGAAAKDVGGIVTGVLGALRSAGTSALGVIGQVLDGVNRWVSSAQGQRVLVEVFAALGRVGEAFVPVVLAIASGLAELAPVVADLAVRLGPVLTDAISAVAPALADLGPGVIAVVDAIGLAVRELGPALSPIAITLAELLAAIAPLIPVVADLASVIVRSLAAGVQDVLPDLARMTYAFTDVLYAALPLLPPLLQLATDLLPVIADLVTGVARLLSGDFTGALTAAGYAAIGFVNSMGNIGYLLLTGLWDGIVSAAAWFRDTIYSFFSAILPDWVRDALGIRSPSRVFAEIGRNTMLGMADGMTSSTGRVLATAGSIAARLEESFAPNLAASIASTGTVAAGASRTAGPVNITVHTYNPQAEPTSSTINRGLAYAGMLGVL
ncbi:hypothetical protein [Nonomuraea longicatena]|uniref:Uncharacterized protein n=1 Tax=Nonomuraea longicatena TaxID=83682 RepID=A0ABP4AE35_9ACTN